VSYLLLLAGCHDDKSEKISEDITQKKESKAIILNDDFFNQTHQPKIDESNIVVIPQTRSDNICYKITPSKTMANTSLEINDSVVNLVSIRDINSSDYYTLQREDDANITIDFLKGHVYEYCIDTSNALSEVKASFAMFTEHKRPDQSLIRKLITTRSCTGPSCNLNYGWLINLDLSNVNVSGALMHDVLLTNSDLSDANMSGTELTNANLIGTTMDGVVLDNADLSFSDVKGASFRGTTFPDGFVFSHLLKYSGLDFTGANLRNTAMLDTDFTYAILRDVNFSGAVLSDTNFAHADLLGADFSHIISMDGADFSYTDLTGLDLDALETIYRSNTKLQDTRFNFFTIVQGTPSSDLFCSAIPIARDNTLLCIDKKYQSIDMTLLTQDQYHNDKPEEHGKKCMSFSVYQVMHTGMKSFIMCMDEKIDLLIQWDAMTSQHSPFFIEYFKNDTNNLPFYFDCSKLTSSDQCIFCQKSYFSF
jgi:uncharacterized protein YjbI with pentapeptide repeats